MGLTIFEHALAKQALQTNRSNSAQPKGEWQMEDIHHVGHLACLCQTCPVPREKIHLCWMTPVFWKPEGNWCNESFMFPQVPNGQMFPLRQREAARGLKPQKLDLIFGAAQSIGWASAIHRALNQPGSSSTAVPAVSEQPPIDASFFCSDLILLLFILILLPWWSLLRFIHVNHVTHSWGQVISQALLSTLLS